MKPALAACLPLTFLVAPVACHAAIPEPVRAMIDAAISSGDPDKVSTIIELAKQTNPDDVAELDELLASFLAQQDMLAAQEAAKEEAAIRKAGLLRNWQGKGQLGAVRSTGNSSNTGITAGLELERTGIDWRHKLTALVDYQRSNGVTTREQYLAAYEPNYQLSEHLYTFALAQYERDRFQGYSARFSASGGLGYRVITADDMQLSVKAGPAYRNTQFIEGGNDSSIAGLAALDFDWKLSNTLKLVEDASAFLQAGNNTFISTTGVEADLGGNLSARISYTVEHDTNPPANAVKTDTLSRITIIYDF